MAHTAQIAKMAELISTLRRKCVLKDFHFVKRAGVSSAEYNCLIQFFDMNALGMKELGERLGITPAGVTRIVSGLEEQGIVERRISPEDRRGINVVLTKKGDRLVADLKRASLDLHAEIINRIASGRRASVIQAMEQLIDAINHWLEGQENMDLPG